MKITKDIVIRIVLNVFTAAGGALFGFNAGKLNNCQNTFLFVVGISMVCFSLVMLVLMNIRKK